jgi:hypothetical protein
VVVAAVSLSIDTNHSQPNSHKSCPESFPNDLKGLEAITSSLETAREFARPSLNSQWKPVQRGFGPAPTHDGFDPEFTERLLPGPDPPKRPL